MSTVRLTTNQVYLKSQEIKQTKKSKAMTLNEFLAIRDQLEATAREAAKVLDTYPRDNMGMVLDSARDERYNKSKNIVNACRDQLHKLHKNNKAVAKQSLKHSIAERDRKRAEKLEALAAAQAKNN